LNKDLKCYLAVIAFTSLFLSSVAAAGQIIGDPRVLDGDTIEVVQGERKVTIRLFGVDAPESAQEGGPESKAYLLTIIRDRQVSCFWEVIDRYERPVGLCYPRTKSNKSWSSVSLNRWLVQHGHAAAYLQYSDHFAKNMHTAMKACRGIWSDLPHCWRRERRGR